MSGDEAHEYYADPEHRKISGPARKHPKDELTEFLSARISPSLLAQVTSASAAEGLPVSTWARRALRNELERSGWRADERRRRKAALTGAAEVTGGHAVEPGCIPRPAGLIEGSGRRGEPREAPSAGRMFSCRHFSIAHVDSATCMTCGPLAATEAAG